MLGEPPGEPTRFGTEGKRKGEEANRINNALARAIIIPIGFADLRRQEFFDWSRMGVFREPITRFILGQMRPQTLGERFNGIVTFAENGRISSGFDSAASGHDS
jgi:hypothetical protein